MGKKIAVLIFLFAAGCSSKVYAQVNISSEMFSRTVTYEIKATVKDSLTSEPVAFASVYLHHPKDTLITDFTLSDTEGKARLPKIPVGDVVFTVEMFGYKPFHKTLYVNKDIDLGEILMQVDKLQLEAAKVTAAANPVEFLQDTIVYNAAAFKTGSNASLGDLLKKMPGIEVEENGSVKVNGKAVDRITVGGRTFFMGDNSAALNNLPATIVNKIKVIDKDSKDSQFTGMKDTDKERVMDVELKEEYKQGWFGNAKAGAGTQIKSSADNEYIEKQKPLFTGNSMMSLYGEKDHLTLISSGNNARSVGDGIMIVYRSKEELNLPSGGVNTSWQTGANINTERIKGLSTTGLVNYIGSDVSLRTRSDMTTYREPDNMFTRKTGDAGGTSNIFKTSFELEKKDKDRFTFHYEPTFYFIKVRKHSGENTANSLGGLLQNTSNAFKEEWTNYYQTSGRMTLGAKKLGKEKRAMTLNMYYDLNSISTDSYIRSATTFASTGRTDELNLDYDGNGYYSSLSGTLGYVEPLWGNWLLNTSAMVRYSSDNSIMDAFNTDGSANAWYSSSTKSYMKQGNGSMRLQYSKESTSIQLGATMVATENEVRATSYGMHTVTGKDEWYYSWSPYVNLRLSPKGYNISFMASGNTSTPSPYRLAPSFNLASPTRIVLGNIYLKPKTDQYFNANLSKSYKESQLSLNISGSISREVDATVNASWYDAEGIRYSIPVNARKPGFSGYANLSLSSPLDKAKKLRLSLYNYTNIRSNIGYQSKGTLDGIDTDSFDYPSFMESFWGDSKGSRFYSGESGFSESRTDYFYGYSNLSLRYSLTENITLDGSVGTTLTKSKYSLDPRANSSLWNDRLFFESDFLLPKDYEVNLYLSYNSYRGSTSEGYADPYWNWDMRFQKSIKSVSLALELFNILNQNKSFSRSVTEDYLTDSYANRLGRYFLFTFTFRFGKMNTAKSGSAKDAAWKMAY